MTDTAIAVPDDDDRDPRLNLPGYDVLNIVGQGGFAVVRRARQHSLQREVAIRSMRVEAAENVVAEMFLREAEILARLQHPHVVSILDCLRHEDRVYLVLEYAAGGTLASKLSGQPQQPTLAAGLVERLARTLEFIHRRGITHCNLKPQNILLAAAPSTTSQGALVANRPYYEDVFGIPLISSFLLALDDQRRASLKHGEIFGTPAYMAPEQVAGRLYEIGPATDIYALGIILYTMLVGHPPFRPQAAGVLSQFSQIVEQEPVAVRKLNPAVDARLEDICLKCLSKRPNSRYARSIDLAQELQDFVERFIN
jgi:serine/threonine protein kinase